MSFTFRRSIRLGKGLRINLSKTGIGLSAGIPGLRYSVHSSGRTTRTVGLPGTGVYFREDSGGHRQGGTKAREARNRRTSVPSVTAPMLPHAGMFAPKDEKEFVKGVGAYMSGNHEAALGHFMQSMRRDTSNEHVAEEFFMAFSLLALGRHEQAIPFLQSVMASPIQIPDGLMAKYHIGGYSEVSITPGVIAELPNSNLTAALVLAELYQERGEPQKAIDLLESLGSISPGPIFALSLAELYSGQDEPDEVLRVAEGFTRNADDATCRLLVFKAIAFHRKGQNDAAVEVLREALRFKKRNQDILREARYARALVYAATGKNARAKQEWERIYAEDPSFRDVSERLGVAMPPRTPPRPDINRRN